MNRANRSIFAPAAIILVASATSVLGQEQEKLTLRRVVALALQNSPDITLARAHQLVAERGVGVNRALFRPNLYTGSGAAFTHGFPQTPGGSAPSVFNLSFVQTLFNPMFRGQAREAEARMEIRGLEVERAKDTVIQRTVTTYLGLAKARHSLELLGKENVSARKVLELTQARSSEGLELPMEVTRAQLEAARIEQRIIQLESRGDILEAELRALTGIPTGQLIEIEPEEIPPTRERSIPDLVELAMTNNLDVKQAEVEMHAREHILEGQRGGYWPSIDLVGQYNVWSRVNNFDDFFRTFQRNNLNAGIQVQIPIFSARTRAAVALARSELAEAEVQLRNKRADLNIEVRRQARRARELNATREVTRLELKLAREQVALLQTRFEEGRVNLRELEKARVEENDKWMAFLDADYAQKESELELLKITGQLTRVFQ